MVYGHGRRCAVSRRPDTGGADIGGKSAPITRRARKLLSSSVRSGRPCVWVIYLHASLPISSRAFGYYFLLLSSTVDDRPCTKSPTNTIAVDRRKKSPPYVFGFRLDRRNRLRPVSRHLTAERSTDTSPPPPKFNVSVCRLFFAVTPNRGRGRLGDY